MLVKCSYCGHVKNIRPRKPQEEYYCDRQCYALAAKARIVSKKAKTYMDYLRSGMVVDRKTGQVRKAYTDENLKDVIKSLRVGY